MSKLSIKAKVTLWYTALLLVTISLGLAYLFSFSGLAFEKQLQERLLDVVADTVGETHFRNGRLAADELDYYQEGISLFLYDTSGRLLAPRTNQGLQVDSILEDQKIKKVASMGENWMVYDLYAQQDGTGFWVRGVVSTSGVTGTLRQMLLLALVAAPLFILCAAVGGWMITRKAFWAVEQITQAADSITAGSDLSLRVPEDPKGGDELSRLGHTINSMLSRLETSFKGERQFTSDASHELRTPTAIIISQCEYALEPQVGEEERLQCIQAVLRQARRMSGMISQLLLLARADSGRFQLKREEVDLSLLCSACVEELAESAHSSQIVLEQHLEEEVLLWGDEMLLLRLITNLLSNAIRYSRPGGRVTVSLSREGGQGVLRIADQGIGIAPENLDRIWQRFFREDSSRRSEGTGLGLPMVRWIAQAHGGEVTVESIPQVGSVFTVRLPLPAASGEDPGNLDDMPKNHGVNL